MGKWKTDADYPDKMITRLADLLEEALKLTASTCDQRLINHRIECWEALDALRVKPKTALTEEVHILRNSLWNLTVNHGEMLDALTEKLEAHLANA